MKRTLIVLLFTALLSGCAGLGVATVGAVMYYKSQNHEVATVDIKAPAENIYKTAINIVNDNVNVEIVKQDAAAMLLDINQGGTAASIKVTSISKNMSKLIISADSSADSSSRVLEGVFRICKELKVECTLAE